MLRAIDADLWELDHPFKLMGVFELGHRMTVMRLSDGGLVLHSPTPCSDQLAAALDELGVVHAILAPSTMHNLWLEPWAERYRDARILAVRGFGERNPTVRVDGVLDAAADLAGLRCLQLAGMPKINECVVLHEASRSLVVADLVFHFPHAKSWTTRMLLRCVGAYGKVGVSRLYRSFVKDRAALRRSLDEVLAWDFDRLVVGHGVIVESGARDELRKAWAWLS